MGGSLLGSSYLGSNSVPDKIRVVQECMRGPGSGPAATVTTTAADAAAVVCRYATENTVKILVGNKSEKDSDRAVDAEDARVS